MERHVAAYIAAAVLVLLQQNLTVIADDNRKVSASPVLANTSRRIWNETWTDKLKRDLMLSYDKYARPAEHTNTTVVHVDLNLKHVDLDEITSQMTVFAWVKMDWIDEKLKWNSSEYGGLTRLHLADHEIWQPDIVLYNSAAGSEVDHYGNTHCIVHEDGTVLWVPPSQFIVFCNLNLKKWPYDEQTCTLRLGSWTYDGDQVDLQIDENAAEMDLLVSNTQWEILEMTRKRNVVLYACCVEPYIDIAYNLTLRRRSPAYSAVVITPATVVVLLTLAAFWLPPHAGEKVVLNAFTALITCILLISFSQRLPAMASHTPLIVVFYSSSLILVTMALMVSVLVLNLARTPWNRPLPWFVKHALSGWLGRLLCVSISATSAHTSLNSAGEELREHGEESILPEDRQMITGRPSARANAAQLDWLLLAIAIDRLAFALYCVIFAILAAAYA